MKKHYHWLTGLILLLITGCSQDNHISRYQEQKKTPAVVTAAAPDSGTGTDMHWTLPEGWKKVPSSSSIFLATFKIEQHDKAQCTLSKFSGDGGGITANINRWRRQIGLGPIEAEVIKAAMKSGKSGAGEFSYITLVNEAKPDKAFIGAIHPAGESIYFVKLSAPAAAMPALQASFLKYCTSLHMAGPGHSHGDAQ